jgi:RNA polymerase sigma-70 factor (ECF subfamily)
VSDLSADVVAAARQGDRRALAELVQATQADVWRFCAFLAGSDAADDLAQETYARALRSLSRFEGRCTVRVWLLSIARRVCADAIRHARRRRQLASALPRPAVEPDHADVLGVVALLQVLGHDRREAFVMTQVLGMPYAEVAAVCRVPVGTVRSRVARARAELADALGDAANQ